MLKTMQDFNRARSEVGWQHGGRERTLWLAAAAAVDDSVAEGVHVTGVRLKLSQKVSPFFLRAR